MRSRASSAACSRSSRRSRARLANPARPAPRRAQRRCCADAPAGCRPSPGLGDRGQRDRRSAAGTRRRCRRPVRSLSSTASPAAARCQRRARRVSADVAMIACASPRRCRIRDGLSLAAAWRWSPAVRAGSAAAIAERLPSAARPSAVAFPRARSARPGTRGGDRAWRRACARYAATWQTKPTSTAILRAGGAALGPIDILVNNAGIARDAHVLFLDAARWDDVLARTSMRRSHCVRAVVRGMLLRRWGRIINVSSPSARHAAAGAGGYAASKAGLEGLTRALSRDLAAKGVLVNAVSPGLIDTEMLEAMPAAGREAAHLKAAAIGRVGDRARRSRRSSPFWRRMPPVTLRDRYCRGRRPAVEQAVPFGPADGSGHDGECWGYVRERRIAENGDQRRDRSQPQAAHLSRRARDETPLSSSEGLGLDLSTCWNSCSSWNAVSVLSIGDEETGMKEDPDPSTRSPTMSHGSAPENLA